MPQPQKTLFHQHLNQTFVKRGLSPTYQRRISENIFQKTSSSNLVPYDGRLTLYQCTLDLVKFVGPLAELNNLAFPLPLHPGFIVIYLLIRVGSLEQRVQIPPIKLVGCHCHSCLCYHPCYTSECFSTDFKLEFLYAFLAFQNFAEVIKHINKGKVSNSIFKMADITKNEVTQY